VKRLLPLVGAVLAACVPTPAPAADPFKLTDGDRVVFLGNTLIEREQRYGYWEMALTTRYPDANIQFRNLGWAGDTVWGQARARFGTQAEGFNHLKEHVAALKPTVIVVGYGNNEAFDGEAGLPHFLDGLNKLLDTLEANKARIVLLSPLRQEDMGRPLPDPTEQNKNIRLYRDAMRKVAEKRGHVFVDLYDLLADVKEKPPLRWTDNGIHLTAAGYELASRKLLDGLGLTATPSSVKEAEQEEKLRAAIIEKNRLYFHRWRPQNETYLFLFRKGEQGQNAPEIPKFDPLVAKQEEEIAKLRVPVKHTYEIKPAKEGDK
jgi:lysophospholipase L1-like esterase